MAEKNTGRNFWAPLLEPRKPKEKGEGAALGQGTGESTLEGGARSRMKSESRERQFREREPVAPGTARD